MTATKVPKRVRADETFWSYGFGWNVSLANVLLDAGELPAPEQFPIGRFVQMLEEGAIKMADHPDGRPIDIERPILLLDFGAEWGIMLMDGWHRVREAHARGLETLPLIRLTGEYEQRVRMQPRNAAWRRIDAMLKGE